MAHLSEEFGTVFAREGETLVLDVGTGGREDDGSGVAV
jgi:hypothetical protein